MKKAIYAFSGDPITYGHIDVIKRALNVFDELVVAIGANPKKTYDFSLQKREEMARRALQNIKNVSVVSFTGMLTAYAYEKNIKTIIKGMRDEKDFVYEKMLDDIGRSQKLGIDTFLMFANKNEYISSSTAKAIQLEQGFVQDFVPLYVKQCLEAKISEQYVVGVTGEIGAGKSFISDKLCEAAAKSGIEAHHIDLDKTAHYILGNSGEEGYEAVKSQIENTFGKNVRKKDGTIDRKVLGEIVFNDYNKLKELDKIMQTPILVRTRKEMYGKKGLIFLDAALIAETDMLYMSNNNIVLVATEKNIQKKRLKEKGLSDEQIQRRLGSQYTFEQKKFKIEERIKETTQGKLWIVDNSKDDNKTIEETLDDIVNKLKVKP